MCVGRGGDGGEGRGSEPTMALPTAGSFNCLKGLSHEIDFDNVDEN